MFSLFLDCILADLIPIIITGQRAFAKSKMQKDFFINNATGTEAYSNKCLKHISRLCLDTKHRIFKKHLWKSF